MNEIALVKYDLKIIRTHPNKTKFTNEIVTIKYDLKIIPNHQNRKLTFKYAHVPAHPTHATVKAMCRPALRRNQSLA